MNHKEVSEYRNNMKERIVRIEASIGIELPHISRSLKKIDNHLGIFRKGTDKIRDEMNDLTDDIAFLKGRINGGGNRG